MTNQSAKFSPRYKLSLISPSSSLADAIDSLNNSGLMICCIVDQNANCIGLLSDSDLRRLMLKSVSLSTIAAEVCNTSPLICSDQLSSDELKIIALDAGKREIPLTDHEGQVTDIFVLGMAESRIVSEQGLSDKVSPPINAEMFILAGGLGTRLRSVVSDRPKPLAQIGDDALIDHVINHALSCGVRKFYFSLNYKAEMIKDHICKKYKGKFEYEYITENKRLGTAGPLSQVKGEIRNPLIVVNADLLTELDYRSAYRSHLDSKSSMTIVVRRHTVKLPYGEVVLGESGVDHIQEKPDKHYLINAGIYIISPHLLEAIQEDNYLDMPDFIEELAANGNQLTPFFMHESWLDVGKPEDYRLANNQFRKHAGGKAL